MDPLFELVTPPPLPPMRYQRFGARGAKWKAWTGAHRPCDDCVQRIHDLGVASAPLPAGASWRRKGPNGELFLCSIDADERKRLDAAVEAEHARGNAHQEHVAKAARSQ